jgi:hypothetical protein
MKSRTPSVSFAQPILTKHSDKLGLLIGSSFQRLDVSNHGNQDGDDRQKQQEKDQSAKPLRAHRIDGS